MLVLLLLLLLLLLMLLLGVACAFVEKQKRRCCLLVLAVLSVVARCPVYVFINSSTFFLCQPLLLLVVAFALAAKRRATKFLADGSPADVYTRLSIFCALEGFHVVSRVYSLRCDSGV